VLERDGKMGHFTMANQVAATRSEAVNRAAIQG